MTHILALNMWIFICSLIGSVYGFKTFFKPKKALYLKMITCGIVCLMFSRLFYVIYLLTQGELNRGFDIGVFGIIGSFMFLFSANYGQMDGLVDDGSKEFVETRITALIAPMVIVIIYAIFFVNINQREIMATVGVVMLFILPCIYYNFKHAIIFDVEFGLIKSVRKYNYLAIAYALFTALELVGLHLSITVLYVISGIAIGAIALTILPVLKGGGKKWTI